MTREPVSNEPNRGRAGLDRRSFLALTAATGAVGGGSGSVLAGRDARTPGVDCGHPNVDCGSLAAGEDGVVASVDPIASRVGASVLREGGNAVDAAVAMQYVLTVTQPHSSGIGGGGFMIVYDAGSGSFTLVDSRERAPAGATPDMFLDDDGDPIPFGERIQMGEAVGVPGTTKGLETALALHGSRPRQRLISPAIRLARDGFPVDDYLAATLENQWEKLTDVAKAAYADGSGDPLSAGETLVQPDLADTLEAIRRGGPEAFYEGAIAEDLAAVVRAEGGAMTADDLAAYDVTLDDPIRAAYGDVELVGQPAPSSGGITVGYILGVLDRLDVEAVDVRSPEKYHLFAEAAGLAYADRSAYIGDPEFVDVPAEGLLDDGYLDSRAALVDPDETLVDYAAGECVPAGTPPGVGSAPDLAAPATGSGGQTTHFTVADGDGNVVSYTSTIEQLFGSGIMVPGRGFVLNNELTDFNAVPEGPNRVEPGKRPMSSMSPTVVVRDGEPLATVGSPGGPTIITTVAQVVLHHLGYGLDLLDAIEEPALYTTDCAPIRWESGVPASARQETTALGHVWTETPTTLGNVNAIRIADDRLLGAADPARDGRAVGLTRGAADPR